jgi:predicted MFS family arabinose efflux permease
MSVVESLPRGESSKPTFSAWWMLLVLLTFYVFSYIDRYIVSMLVQPIKADLQLSDFKMSLILGPAFAVFYSIAGIPLGWCADRLPRRWVIFGGVFFWSMATVATGLARSFTTLFAARIAVGVGEAALTPATYTLIGDKFPRSRLTTAIAIYQGGGRLGPAIAFAFGGVAIGAVSSIDMSHLPLIGAAKPWQIVMFLVGAPGVLLAFLVFTFAEPARTGKTAEAGSNFTLLFGFLRQNAALMALMLIGFSMCGVCAYALSAWTPAYLERRFSMSPAQYGPALGLISILWGASLLVKGPVVDWLFGRGMKDAHIRFYTWSLIAVAPVPWFVFRINNPWIFLFVLGYFEVVALTFLVYLAATLTLIAPNQLRGQLSAIFLSTIVTVGSGLGPMLVGAMTTFVLRDEAALGTAISIVAGVSVLVALAALRLALPFVGPAVSKYEAS